MRVTNNMLIRNMMLNMNRNLGQLDKTQHQMSTGKKIRMASDDPIVASRAMRFRTDVSEIEQFQKNTSDALSWLEITEQGVDNLGSVIHRASELTIQAGGALSPENKLAIKEEISQLKRSILEIGNMSYAGRYIYAGFKTDEKPFDVEEYTVDGQTMERLTYRGKALSLGGPVQESIDGEAFAGFYEASHEEEAFYPKIENFKFDEEYEIVGAEVKQFDLTLDGVKKSIGITEDISFDEEGIGDAVTHMQEKIDDAFGEGRVKVSEEEGRLTFTAMKGDLLVIGKSKTDSVDIERLGFKHGTSSKQEIRYEVGVGNTINVNLEGHELFGKGLSNLYDTFVKLEMALQGETAYKTVVSSETSEDVEVTTHTLTLDEIIGEWQTSLDNVLKVRADIGARVNYVELVNERLKDTHINFTNLKSINEDVDMAQTIINLQNQENVYRASLSSGARIIQPTLLDFLR